MRKVCVNNVKPGVTLAKTIYSIDGRILLSSGVVLRQAYLKKLKDNGVTEIFIEDELSQGIEVDDAICEDTRQEAKALVKEFIDNYDFFDNAIIDKVKEVIDKIIEDLLSKKDIVLSLSDIKSVDDYTFEHSVNVCILSVIIGIEFGYNEDRLKDLGVGALLHDIGKLRIPPHILKKPSQLTVEEFEEIKKHTLYGYEMLKNNTSISMISAFIAFSHHERYDGSGYPLQLKGQNIHECARIVAVADVYDALTSDRVYRKKLHPREVFEYVTSLRTYHFDQHIVNSFVKHVSLYPVGSGVMLNTRERALVVRINLNMPTRPVIRVVYDARNRKVNKCLEIDLIKNLDLFIMDACEIV